MCGAVFTCKHAEIEVHVRCLGTVGVAHAHCVVNQDALFIPC